MSDLDFIKDLANADRYEKSKNFTGGAGVAVLNDVKVFKSTKDGGDPFTWVKEVVIKSSRDNGEGVPNAPGTKVGYMQKLTRATHPKSMKSNVLKAHLAILGPGSEALTPAQLEPVLAALLRPLPAGNPLAGRTDPSKPCPERGRQIAYDTYKGKDGRFYPNFYAIPQTDADLAENLKLLDSMGASTEE